MILKIISGDFVVIYENRCKYHCVDNPEQCERNCYLRNVKIYICDICQKEKKGLYKYNQQEVCLSCLLDNYDVVD